MKSVSKIIITLIVLLIPVQVQAFYATTTTDQGFDQSLADKSNISYVTPTKIYIAQITTQASELQKNPSLWIKSLYYYSITRLHFADIPYNYIVDNNGIVYEGRLGGVGANPEMKNSEGCILIGYLSNDPILTNRASTSMRELIDTLGSQWGIATVNAVKLSITQQEGLLSKLTTSTVSDDFAQSTSDMLTGWQGYATENLEYKAKIESVEYEQSAVVASKLHVKVNVKNMNDFVWLTDKNPIYISVQSDNDSKYAINGVWDSFKKPTHVSDKAVLPGDTVTFEFDLLAQTAPGEALEKFEIQKFDKKPFKDSQFEVKFSIVKGDKTLVQVSSSQYGFVNVRECQWYSCKVIDSPENGVVFILLEQTDDGWMKIQYDENTVGWVYGKYMKKI